MKMIQTLDHRQGKPVNPLPGRGWNRPARLDPRQAFQQMDRFRPLFEEAVLTTGTVGNHRSACRLPRDPVQKTIRQAGMQSAQAAAVAAAMGGGRFRNGEIRNGDRF